MRYSQRDGVNTSLSRLVLYPRVSLLVSLCVLYCVFPLYYPWHGHVLPGTIIIKIMGVHKLYLQG